MFEHMKEVGLNMIHKVLARFGNLNEFATGIWQAIGFSDPDLNHGRIGRQQHDKRYHPTGMDSSVARGCRPRGTGFFTQRKSAHVDSVL